MIGFPKNPPNGMIFEASPGLFFEFSASEDCWIRVDGLEALGLATVLKDGLMSPDDLKKLNGLIIPPPQSTLKGEECKTTFTQGKVRLTSTDDSLSVSPNLQLFGKNLGLVQPWSIHENTAGYDFKLNFDDLLKTLKQNGKFTQVQIQGKQGLKGDKGNPGLDKLNTGPKGETGPAGANSPYKGVISTEPNALQLVDDNANRAIVDIQAVSGPDGNFLIATRANIGNPNACPGEVTPKDIVSPQVLVLNKKENALIRTLEDTNDCHNPCTICVTSLHYVNMEMLLDSMFERFLEQLAALKTAKEELAITWLQAMIAIFNEQKAALCCSLENCKSIQRNSTERRFIEQQRIQASQANQQLVLDGNNDREIISGNPDKDCTMPVVDAKVRRGIGCDCVLQFTLDGKAHSTDPRGLFFEKPVAQVDVRVNNAFQTNRDGLLQVHSEMSSNTGDALGPGVPIITSRTINVDTGIAIPPAAGGTSTTIAGTPPSSDNIPTAGTTSVSSVDPNVPWGHPNVVYNQRGGEGPRTITLPGLDPNSWIISINNFSAIVNPDHDGTITITVVLTQGETTIATFQGTMPLAQVGSQTITLPIQTFDAPSLTDPATILANQAKPIQMVMKLDTSVTFSDTEITTFVAADYTLGSILLSNHDLIGLVSADLTLQSDWTSNDWSVDDTVTAQGSNNGFVQLSLPAGTYVAEIIDCCVDMTNTRHLWQGTAAIEYNTIDDVTAAGGTVAPDPNFTRRATVLFPDLGSFNNNADARTKYLGSTISFTHLGGQIRAWVVDPDGLPSNNDGSLTICIKAIQCVNSQIGSVPIDPGAIFVYSNIISPLNLIGIIRPFLATGTENLDAVQNYGYNEVTAEAAHITHGPNRSTMTTKSFFYQGPDGLSFFMINGGTGQDKQNNIKMTLGISGNVMPSSLLVADDPEEVAKLAPDPVLGELYNTNWTIGTTGSDGLVLGYFDNPVTGAWQIAITPTDMGIQQLWEAVSADGNRFALALRATGMGTTFASQQIIFTPIKAGCVMSFKQIQWLERGHRTGAACSAVVNIDGTNYVIVKRSIADDKTCGGGESLSNPCISQYIAMGAGHPAIAWPTVNGEEFIGIPTSGGHGFMFDQAFSDKVLAKIAADDMTHVTGDPKNNIPFVLVATS